MRYEHSFGIIPLRKYKETWRVLLVQHQSGHWSFPKGHPEKDETAKTAASRELKEETGLSVVQYLPEEPLIEHYFFTLKGEKVSKKVCYFIAEVKGRKVAQEAEIAQCQWFNFEEASLRLTFPQARLLLKKAWQALESRDWMDLRIKKSTLNGRH
jgi:bis(5'-nucleosidyl)-tetraphosphatase